MSTERDDATRTDDRSTCVYFGFLICTQDRINSLQTAQKRGLSTLKVHNTLGRFPWTALSVPSISIERFDIANGLSMDNSPN